MRFLPVAVLLLSSTLADKFSISNITCGPNQVITGIAVGPEWNADIRVECGTFPCGASDHECTDDNTSCDSNTEFVQGVSKGDNETNVLLRCCTITGFDAKHSFDILFTSMTSTVPEELRWMHYPEYEFDFVSNIRIEEEGARAWFHRVKCYMDEKDFFKPTTRVIDPKLSATPMKCGPNEVITSLTHNNDGRIEAECSPLPCGSSGGECSLHDLSVTKCNDRDNVTLAGFSTINDGRGINVHCCSLSVPERIFTGADLVTAGNLFDGGAVRETDKLGDGGDEFDFISNVRMEQRGVRVLAYRVICPSPSRAARTTFSNYEH